MANYGRNFTPDQRFFLGPQGGTLGELRGVQSVNGGWDKPEDHLQVLGRGYAGTVSNGPLEHSLTINRLMINEDDAVTGLLENMVEGVLVYGPNAQFNKFLPFTSGYVTSYNSSSSIGDVPSADITLSIYGDMGGTTGNADLDRTSMATAANIPLPANIELDVSGYASNAVQSYSISIPISRQRIETLGNNFISTGSFVELPIPIEVEFDMIVNEFEAPNIRDILCSPPQQTLTIQLNDCGGDKIRAFTIESGRFVGFGLNASVGDNMDVTVNYISYYNSLQDVERIFS